MNCIKCFSFHVVKCVVMHSIFMLKNKMHKPKLIYIVWLPQTGPLKHPAMKYCVYLLLTRKLF